MLRRLIYGVKSYSSFNRNISCISCLNLNQYVNLHPNNIFKRFATTNTSMSAVTYANVNWNNNLNEARQDFYSHPGTDKLRWRAMAYLERQNQNYDNVRSIFEEYLRMDPNAIVIYNDLASLEISLKHYEQACSIYEYMYNLDSSNTLAIKGLMYVYRVLGKDEKLRKIIDKSKNIISLQDNLGYTLEMAKNLYLEGKIDKSREYFINCAKNEYTWKYIFLEWSSLEYRFGHKEAATHVLFNGLKLLNSRDMEIPTRMYHMLGLYLQDQGRLDDAIACYNAGTYSQQAPYLCWKEWAKLELFRGHWDICNHLYLYALSQIKNEPGLWLSYISILEKTNHNQLLPLVLKESYTMCSDSNRIQQKYISYQTSVGNIQLSKSLLEQYIKQFPTDIYGYLSLALQYRKENNLESAQELYRQALQLPSGREKVFHEMAVMYLSRKNPEEAKSCLKQALSIRKDMSILKELADIEISQGHYDIALTYLQEALDSSSYQRTKELAQIYAAKARVLAKVNRINESESCYLDSLRVNKYNIPVVLSYCDDILLKQKRWKEAIQLLNKGLEIDRVGTCKSDMNERLLYALKQTRNNNK